MIVVASENGRVGIQAAVDILKAGGSAIDAVEAGIRLVEDNEDEHSVGRNSYPNLLGDLELDASIMNGRTLESGAVSALQNYPAAISVARAVMEKLPHVHLTGEGAGRLAAELGFARDEKMLSAETLALRETYLRRVLGNPAYENLEHDTRLWDRVKVSTDPEKKFGTVNFIAQDANNDICCGVSTSGWAWKYPGRVGDSPIIGAGNYADNRYGAAACTGTGEMAIRSCTAHSLVFYMKMGMSVAKAAEQAMTDLRDLGGAYISRMNLIAIDRDGHHCGYTSMATIHYENYSTRPGTYIFQSPGMTALEEVERTFIDIPGRWPKDEGG